MISVFKICYDTYAQAQDDKLKEIELSWDDVGEEIKKVEKDIQATELAERLTRESMLNSPKNCNKEPYITHLDNLAKKLETLEEYKALLERNFPLEFN